MDAATSAASASAPRPKLPALNDDVVVHDDVLRAIVVDYLLRYNCGQTALALTTEAARRQALAPPPPAMPLPRLLLPLMRGGAGDEDSAAMDVDQPTPTPSPAPSPSRRASPWPQVLAGDSRRTPTPTQTPVLQPSEAAAQMVLTPEYQSLAERRAIYQAVVAGNIAQALELIGRFDMVFKGAPGRQLLFRLQCLQFVELVKANQHQEALALAQQELAAFGYENPRCLATLQDVVALLAYSDIWASPVAYLLKPSLRQELADAVNAHILTLLGCRSYTVLERLIQQTTVAHDLISADATLSRSHKLFFPSTRWQLSDFVSGNTDAGSPLVFLPPDL